MDVQALVPCGSHFLVLARGRYKRPGRARAVAKGRKSSASRLQVDLVSPVRLPVRVRPRRRLPTARPTLQWPFTGRSVDPRLD